MDDRSGVCWTAGKAVAAESRRGNGARFGGSEEWNGLFQGCPDDVGGILSECANCFHADHSLLGEYVSELGGERDDGDAEYLRKPVGAEYRRQRDVPALQFGYRILLSWLWIYGRAVEPVLRSAVFIAVRVGVGGYKQLPFDAAFAAALDGARLAVPDELRVRQVDRFGIGLRAHRLQQEPNLQQHRECLEYQGKPRRLGFRYKARDHRQL